MILTCELIGNIIESTFFELDINEEDKTKINMEICNRENQFLIFAINYTDLYYISYSMNIVSTQIDSTQIDFCSLVIPYEGILKIKKIVMLWPNASIKLTKSTNGYIYISLISSQLRKERPVNLECRINPAINNYVVESPDIKYNCVINSTNLKQMIDICSMINDSINLQIENRCLVITNNDQSIKTSVILEKIIDTTDSYIIKLSSEINNLILQFLGKLCNQFNNAYLLFIKNDMAFSIKIIVDELTSIELYTIHE